MPSHSITSRLFILILIAMPATLYWGCNTGTGGGGGGAGSGDAQSDADQDDPAFTADGSQILFVSNRDGNEEIYIMDLDGTNLQRLTNNPADDSEPAVALPARFLSCDSGLVFDPSLPPFPAP